MSQEDYGISVCVCVSLLIGHHPLLVHTRPFFFHSHEAIFEVAPEPRWLVALHLPVLDRTPTQVLVQLGDVDCCCTLLVLRRGVSYPVVDVRRLAWALVLTYLVKNKANRRLKACSNDTSSLMLSQYCTHIKNNVTVSLKEVAKALSWNRHHLHVLNEKTTTTMLDIMKSYTKIRPVLSTHTHTQSSMVFVPLLTHIDGPYLQARLSADISKCVLIVIIHHSAELKQTHMSG